MHQSKKIAISFFVLKLLSTTMASALELKRLDMLPAALLDSSAAGMLRQVCLDKKSFLYYSGRAGSSFLQLMDGPKARECESKELVIQKRVEVLSARLNRSESGAIRTFDFGGELIMLITAKNGAATLIQVNQ